MMVLPMRRDAANAPAGQWKPSVREAPEEEPPQKYCEQVTREIRDAGREVAQKAEGRHYDEVVEEVRVLQASRAQEKYPEILQAKHCDYDP